jgi:hypothetical protein
MRLGYSRKSHCWVNFYNHLAKLLGPGNHVVQSTQCDIFFYTFNNTKDIQKCRKGTRLVFVSGECWDTSKMQCSLLIDCKYISRPSVPFMYYPFYALSFFERSANVTGQQLIKPPSFDAQSILRTKTKFCAFMYRYDVDFRVRLYDCINRYRPVDALGKSRNKNPKITTDRAQSTYMDSAVEKYKPYKFVICCENTRYPGYVTEKIVNSMLANAIPIYYGASDIAQHFNPKSFIDIGSFPSWDAAIEYIRKVDQYDNLYFSMLQEPWYHNNTPSKYFDSEYIMQYLKNIQVTNHRLLQSQSRHHIPLTRVKQHPRQTRQIQRSPISRTNFRYHSLIKTLVRRSPSRILKLRSVRYIRPRRRHNFIRRSK